MRPVPSRFRGRVRTRRRHHRGRPQRPRVRRVPCEGRLGCARPGETRSRRRRGGHRGAVARLPGLERFLRRIAHAAAGRPRARPQALRLRGFDHHAGLLRAVPRRHVAHAVGRRRTRRRQHREVQRTRRRGLRRVRSLLRSRRPAAEGSAVRRAAEHEPARPPQVGGHRGPVPQMERTRPARDRPLVHDERGRFPRRVVRGRTRQGCAGDAGHHRRVVRTDDAGFGLRPDAPLDRRGGRSRRRVGLGEGRHGRHLPGDGSSRRSGGRRDPHERGGRPRRDQRERQGGGRRAGGRLPRPSAADRLVCASGHDVPVARGRGAAAGRRGPGREAVPDAVGLGQAQRRPVRAAGLPVVGSGGRPAQGAGRRSRPRSSTSNGRGTTRSTAG